MCAMQSRAPLNASMCAQQTRPGWKGLCKVPVCSALSLCFCVGDECTQPGPFSCSPLFTLNADTVLCCERISIVISPLRGLRIPLISRRKKAPQKLPEVCVRPATSVKDECCLTICFQVKQTEGFYVCQEPEGESEHFVTRRLFLEMILWDIEDRVIRWRMKGWKPSASANLWGSESVGRMNTHFSF